MNNPPNFDPTQRTQQLGDRTQQLGDRTNQIAPPTTAIPTGATQPVQPTAWSEQGSYEGGGYSYGEAPTDNYYDQPQQHYNQAPPAYGQHPMAAPEAPIPWYRKPGVLFGGAAGAALVAVAALIATWQMGGVSTTPANTTGTPSQQVQVPLAPAPTQAPVPVPAAPSQPVIVQQPAPRSVPRQQAPAPRLAPNNPPVIRQAPVSPVPNPNPVPPPDQKQVPPPDEKQVPPPDEKQVPPPDEKQVPPPDEKQVPPPDEKQARRRTRRRLRRRTDGQASAAGRTSKPPPPCRKASPAACRKTGSPAGAAARGSQLHPRHYLLGQSRI